MHTIITESISMFAMDHIAKGHIDCKEAENFCELVEMSYIMIMWWLYDLILL